MRDRPKRVWFITALLVLFMFTTIGAVVAAENYGQIVSDISPLLDRIENFEPEDCENGIALLEKITDALWSGINGNEPVLTDEEQDCLNFTYKVTDETIKASINGGLKKYIGMASSGGFTGYAGFLDAVENNNLQYLSDLVKFINNGTSAQAKNMLNYYGLDFADLMVSASELLQVEYEPGLPVTQKVLDQYEQKLQAIVDRTEGKRTLEDFAECGLTAANLADAVDQLSSEEKEQLELILDKLGLINHKPVAEVEPADGATGVELDAEVKATFDRDVVEGDLSGVKIEAGGVEMDVLAALEGRVLTVAHPDFAYLTEYTVTIPADAVLCEHGVGNDEIVWSFTTRDVGEEDKPAAEVEPADGATGVELDAEVKATFDRDVVEGDLSGVRIEAGGVDMDGVTAALEGRVLTVAHPDFAYLTEYTVTIPADAVLCEHGVGNDEIVWSFTTKEDSGGGEDKPLAEVEPADGASDVELDAVVKATFDRDVIEGDLSGVKIEVSGDQPMLMVIMDVTATLEGRVLTIAHDDFDYFTEYTVTIPAGAVQTESGIANDEIVWSFTTKEDSGGGEDKPVAEVEPADGATGVALDAEVKATFDRDVVEGDLSGVKIEAGGVAMDGVTAALEGRVLTVTHPGFAFYTEYTVTIPAGAVQTEAGVANDEIVWSFTTKEDDTPVGPYILTVQTDKAIYEPDEAVEVSGLLLENNEAQNPVPDVAVGLVLYLGDDEIIFEQTYTDATGAFAWTIPANTLELGDYRVYATVNEASAEASFKVSTEATGKPEIKIYKPAPGDNYVQLNAEVSATFNMDVTAVDLEGVRIEKDGVTLNGVSVSLEGRVLKLSHPRFSYRTTYEVIIPAGAVEGETGLLNDEARWSFRTRSGGGGGGGIGDGESIYLSVEEYEPEKGAKDIATDAEVKATFNLNIKAVDLGKVYIEDSKGKIVRGVKASISGKVLTIEHDEFAGGVTYRVVIPAKTVGVRNSSETNREISWKFTTAVEDIEECTFDDVTGAHWAAEMIEELCLKGYINGYPDGTFKPDNNITRAEMTKILVKVQGLEEADPDMPQFKDVNPSDWYYGYIEAAARAGLVKGYETGEFRPNQKITREEIAALICRAMGKESEAASLANVRTEFTDDQDIAAWARGYVVIEFREGIVNGYPDQSFGPKKNATRAEVCAMVFRYINSTDNE
ncbi:MAG TPA: hypothetical protein GXZ25_11245 [Peptococcaceae bacterium]|nr:hypothetical protein [Peptococcaceae bacterium]